MGCTQKSSSSSRFTGPSSSSSSSGVDIDFDFDDWNEWREVDGFMCRDTADCSWVDERLYCQDYEFDFNPSVSVLLAWIFMLLFYPLLYRLGILGCLNLGKYLLIASYCV